MHCTADGVGQAQQMSLWIVFFLVSGLLDGLPA